MIAGRSAVSSSTSDRPLTAASSAWPTRLPPAAATRSTRWVSSGSRSTQPRMRSCMESGNVHSSPLSSMASTNSGMPSLRS